MFGSLWPAFPWSGQIIFLAPCVSRKVSSSVLKGRLHSEGDTATGVTGLRKARLWWKKKKKSPPGRSMRRTAGGGHLEPGGVSFTEVTVWKTLGRPGLRRRHIGGETKQAAAAFPPPLQHISGLNHTFRSARRFRSRPSLPVSLGSAAAGFFVRCSWFRRAPGVLF